MPANLIGIQEQGADLSDQYLGVDDVKSIADGYLSESGLDIKNSGTLWNWGYPNSYTSPVQLGTATNWKSVSDAYGGIDNFIGVKTDGTTWTSTSTSVSSFICKTAINGKEFYAAVKSDGTLWTWGNNDYGQLGQGDITSRSVPTQVGTLTNWKQVTGNRCVLAIKTDGTLWAWGNNDYGQLGLSDRTHRSSPVQIGSLTNWKQVSYNSSAVNPLAIKTDGTLWSWGAGLYYGQLGLGDLNHRSSPTQVGSLTNWKTVNTGEYSSAAIKTDGTLWMWGSNNWGQMGLGNTTSYSSPVQVGTLTDWKQVCPGGGGQFTIALKTDGTLWGWGKNAHIFGNQLGIPDGLHRSSPVQIGSLTNWKLIYAGNYSAYAIK